METNSGYIFLTKVKLRNYPDKEAKVAKSFASMHFKFIKMKLRKYADKELKGDALSYRASPLPKQSTGLFGNSPLAERPTAKYFAVCGRRAWTPSLHPASFFKKSLGKNLSSPQKLKAS